MLNRPAAELLFDSETTLRLVDNALHDLRTGGPEMDSQAAAASDLANASAALTDLPQILLRAYHEILSVQESLRQSRTVLEQNTVEKLQHTKAKLNEVTSATEVAATDIMDGVDRALGLVDQLDAEEAPSERAAELRGALRDELFTMMSCLQFQDITSQQINYASSVLVEMEQRLAQLARIFDPQSFGLEPVEIVTQATPPVAFDPAATLNDADERQALVDEILRGSAGS